MRLLARRAAARRPRSARSRTCPTLVLDGAADLRTPAEQARRVAAAIPGARVVTVPNTGHSVARQRPQRLRATTSSRRSPPAPTPSCKPTATPIAPTPAPAAAPRRRSPAGRARCARSPRSARRSTTCAGSSSATRSRPAGPSAPARAPAACAAASRGSTATSSSSTRVVVRPGRARLGHLRDQARPRLAAARHRAARRARTAGDRRRPGPPAASSAGAASRRRRRERGERRASESWGRGLALPPFASPGLRTAG